MRAPQLEEMLDRLIALPSVSSTRAEHDQSNQAVAEQLGDWLIELGFSVELIDVPERPGKVNLIATLGHGEGGLVLAGHTDTVPCDAEDWQHDPFVLEKRDGRYYGLGTSDMKSFFAIAIEALRPLLDAHLKAPLILLATADEECGMFGARQLLELGRPSARVAVIGEPTELRPVRMHKGILMERIRVQGRAGHSSRPDLGNSALESMHLVMGALLDMRTALQRQYRVDAFPVPTPTLNLGCVHGGDSPNRICAHAELQYDLRTVPGMNIEQARQQLHAAVEDALRGRGTPVEFEALFSSVAAFETAADSELVRACEELCGAPAEAVGFATEAPFLQQLGMETIVLGAGSIEQAHQPDEYLSEPSLHAGVLALRRLIERYCLTEDTSS